MLLLAAHLESRKEKMRARVIKKALEQSGALFLLKPRKQKGRRCSHSSWSTRTPSWQSPLAVALFHSVVSGINARVPQ